MRIASDRVEPVAAQRFPIVWMHRVEPAEAARRRLVEAGIGVPLFGEEIALAARVARKNEVRQGLRKTPVMCLAVAQKQGLRRRTLQANLREHAFDGFRQIVEVAFRLRHHVRYAGAQRLDDSRFVGEPGNEDGRQRDALPPQPAKEIKPCFSAPELIVEHEQIGPVALDARARRHDVRTRKHATTRALERFSREAQDALVVVDDEHAGSCRARRGVVHTGVRLSIGLSFSLTDYERTGCSGSVTKNVDPTPSSDSTHVRPPCRSVTRRTSASPMPSPLVRSPCSRWNALNIFDI